ncbi:MAG: hypothetical protein IPN93_00345 [Bacteroidetes bacterium]|nr:hypothetical protein [Bacteroidota bacterium]MBL0077555.1 hypothetical protein [Bacteroidota bacterium]
MKSIVSILFSFVFLLSTMQETTFILVFNLNKKAIIENYCINKAKKEMQCNARCYLKENIEKKEDKNNPFSILNLKVREIEYCSKIQHLISEISILEKIVTPLINNSYLDKLLKGIEISLIKPPTLFK